jgi:hypothetical protein
LLHTCIIRFTPSSAEDAVMATKADCNTLGPRFFGGRLGRRDGCSDQIFLKILQASPFSHCFADIFWTELIFGLLVGMFMVAGNQAEDESSIKVWLELILPYPVIPKLSRMLLNSISMCPGHSIMTLQLESE